MHATNKPSVKGKRGTAPSSEALLELVTTSLEDDKAIDVTTIDLAGKSSIADFMIVASGRSNRQVTAIADHLLRKLKDGGYGSARVEGLPQADWVLVDAGDIIVHVFRPEVREFYNLEKMWLVDLGPEAQNPVGNGADAPRA